MQLAVARVVILELDVAQEHQQLSADEGALRRDFMVKTLGLVSLNQTMARQRARSRFLKEGYTNTCFFNFQACHRRRKNFLAAITHEAKENLVFQYYNHILGASFIREHTIDLSLLQLRCLDLH